MVRAVADICAKTERYRQWVSDKQAEQGAAAAVQREERRVRAMEAREAMARKRGAPLDARWRGEESRTKRRRRCPESDSENSDLLPSRRFGGKH